MQILWCHISRYFQTHYMFLFTEAGYNSVCRTVRNDWRRNVSLFLRPQFFSMHSRNRQTILAVPKLSLCKKCCYNVQPGSQTCCLKSLTISSYFDSLIFCKCEFICFFYHVTGYFFSLVFIPIYMYIFHYHYFVLLSLMLFV
jgi:hypothetical protein